MVSLCGLCCMQILDKKKVMLNYFFLHNGLAVEINVVIKRETKTRKNLVVQHYFGVLINKAFFASRLKNIPQHAIYL